MSDAEWNHEAKEDPKMVDNDDRPELLHGSLEDPADELGVDFEQHGISVEHGNNIISWQVIEKDALQYLSIEGRAKWANRLERFSHQLRNKNKAANVQVDK